MEWMNWAEELRKKKIDFILSGQRQMWPKDNLDLPG